MVDVVDHATPAKRKSTEGCDNGEQNCKSHCGGIDRGIQPIDLHVFGSNKEEWVGKSVVSVCGVFDIAIQFPPFKLPS